MEEEGGLGARARALMAQLASAPRPAGSDAEVRARTLCARWLLELGFAVTERPFEYSALPGRLGTPLAGVGAAATILAALALDARGRAGHGLALLLVAAVALALGGRWMARRGVLLLPLMRRTSVNLFARYGKPRPDVWIVAHLDSKSQPVPIGLRALGVAGSVASWMAAIALLAASAAGAVVPAPIRVALGVAVVLCALPVVASVVGARSHGAVDNASGVAAVLAAAAILQEEGELEVGVALTSGEELGLAGARAWAAGTPPAIALNCDSLDDGGGFVAMHSGGASGEVVEALVAAADATGAGVVQVRRLPPGILTDHVALSAAGWATATLSHGQRRTLLRIHTRGDSMDNLRGDKVMPAARLLAAAASRLARSAGHALGSPAVEGRPEAAG